MNVSASKLSNSPSTLRLRSAHPAAWIAKHPSAPARSPRAKRAGATRHFDRLRDHPRHHDCKQTYCKPSTKSFETRKHERDRKEQYRGYQQSEDDQDQSDEKLFYWRSLFVVFSQDKAGILTAQTKTVREGYLRIDLTR